MIYIFGTLIFVALAIIIFLVLKYCNPLESSFFKKKPKAVDVKGEDFWLSLIKDNPKNPYPYKKLGDWYLENNKKKYAIESFRHALRLDPQDGNLKSKLMDLSD